MKKYILFLIACSLLLATSLPAGEVTKVGTSAAQFLKIGVGARATAMGESFVALANDASAIYWNPAGLADLDKNELLLAHTDWIADMSYDFGGLVIPTQMGNFAVYAMGLTMGEMERRTEYEPEGTGEMFTASDVALGVSYGAYFTDRFAFGFSAKYIKQSIWQESAQTFAVDVGITYKTELENLRLGMTITNFGGKMQMDGRDLLRFVDIDPNLEGNNEQIITRLNTEQYDLPLAFRIGLAWDVIKTPASRITVATDALSPNDYTEYVNAGLEYAFREMVFLRGGYKGLGVPGDEVGYALGGGVNYDFDSTIRLRIDYAYSDFGRLDNTQRISMGILF